MTARRSPIATPVDKRFELRRGHLPPTADLVVVGAGVIGCATAFCATAAGLRTVVIDARPGPATLTTAAATGAYRLQHDNAEELALVREGVELLFDFPAGSACPATTSGCGPRATSSARPSRARSSASAGWSSASTASGCRTSSS